MTEALRCQFDHALVLGGTGMLAEFTRQLEGVSNCLTLVARNATSCGLGGPATHIVDADWSRAGFADDVLTALNPPPIDLLVAWVHRDGRSELDRLGQALADGHQMRFLQLFGSSGGEPPSFATNAGVVFQRVDLGSAEGGRRWLTHAEISSGTMAALCGGEARTLVGEPSGE